MASIEQRSTPAGQRWRVVWRESGVKQHEPFTSLRAAERFRGLVEAHGSRWPRGWVPGSGFDDEDAPMDALTFGEFARATIKTRSTANPRTRHDYLRDLERHVFPTFGDAPIEGITQRQAQQWLVALQDQRDDDGRRRMSAKTLKNLQGLVSSIMADAITAGAATRNPFKGGLAALPAARVEEMAFLTRPEFETLLRFVSDHYRPLTLTLALTGMRWSEATALAVGQLELPLQRVTVTRAWKRTPGGYFEIGEPKSRRSRRTISVPPRLVETLAPLVAGRGASDLVFTTREGRPVRHNNYRGRVWVPARDRAAVAIGKKPRIHDLRHSHAAWLIAAGVPLPAIQRRLGHESITTTIDRYGHLAPELEDAITAALDGMDGDD